MAKKKPDPEPAKPSKPAAKAEAKPTPAAPKPAAAKTVAPTVKSAPAAPAPIPSVKVVLKPSKDEVSKRAFEIWVAKGKPHGKDLENWQQAEKELGA